MEVYYTIGSLITIAIIAIAGVVYIKRGELDGLQQLNDGGDPGSTAENESRLTMDVDIAEERRVRKVIVDRERRKLSKFDDDLDIDDAFDTVDVAVSVAHLANEISEHVHDVQEDMKQNPESYKKTGLEISDDESIKVSSPSRTTGLEISDDESRRVSTPSYSAPSYDSGSSYDSGGSSDFGGGSDD